MIDTLNKFSGDGPEGVITGIKREAERFANGAEQFDDLTMLCLELK